MSVLVGQIGFNPLDAFKQVARTSAQVAADPRTQRVAATAANAYYPEQYQQVQQGVDQARQVLRQNDVRYQQLMQRQAQRPRMMPMPMMPQFDPDGAPTSSPVEHGNIIGLIGIGAAGLVLFLLLRK